MPRTYSTWVFTKAREYSPTGTLQLGQILAEPFNPGFSLMPGGPLPVPPTILQEESRQESVAMNSADDLTATFGVWARVAGLPAGGEAGTTLESSNELSWHFDQLSSRIMSPSLEYIRAAMRHGDVPEHIKGKLFNHRLYMITGTRTAHGARMEKEASRSFGVTGAGQVEGQSIGAPIDVGVKTAFKSSSSNKERFQNASDFVYAYRLNEINYRWKISQRPFERGETESVDGGRNYTNIGIAEIEDFEVDGIDEDDFDGDDGTECVVTTHKMASPRDSELEYEFLIALK